MNDAAGGVGDFRILKNLSERCCFLDDYLVSFYVISDCYLYHSVFPFVIYIFLDKRADGKRLPMHKTLVLCDDIDIRHDFRTLLLDFLNDRGERILELFEMLQRSAEHIGDGFPYVLAVCEGEECRE